MKLYVYCTRKTHSIKTGKHNYINIRPMKNYTKYAFLQNLRQVQFPNYTSFNCINEAYTDFIEKVMTIINKIAPFKVIRVKGYSKPWFDNEVLEKINIRDKLKKIFTKSKLHVDYENFICAKKQEKKLLNKTKCEYVKEQINANIAKPTKPSHLECQILKRHNQRFV